jgi:outer membrane protein OmpA-like peptidoglycan-associated protein
MNLAYFKWFLRFLGIATFAFASGCASNSYLVLLKNADGSTGRVNVTGAKGTTTLDEAGLGAKLDGSTAKPFPVDAEKLYLDFGAALGAQPQTPVTFLLYFEAGGAELTSESKALIEKILAELATRSSPDMSVIGHTDTVGDASANEALGLKRAEQVSQLLSTGKIKQIDITSHGKRNLLVATPDNTAEAKNRRVEVTIR